MTHTRFALPYFTSMVSTISFGVVTSGRLSLLYLCLPVTSGVSFKIGRGDVIEEEVKGGIEHLSVTVLKMTAEIIFIGQEDIEGTVEPVIVDLCRRGHRTMRGQGLRP